MKNNTGNLLNWKCKSMVNAMLLLSICLLLFACSRASLRPAEMALQAGDYMGSMMQLRDYLNQQKQLPTGESWQRSVAILQQASQHYQSLATQSELMTRIEGNEGLLALQQLLISTNYHQELSTQVVLPEAQLLEKKLATDYQLAAEAIKGHQQADYQQRADYYSKSLYYQPNPQIQQRYHENQKQSSTLLAAEHYQQGKQAVENQLFFEAAQQFRQAAELYQPYGDYLDSRNLAEKYQREAELIQADSLYYQAQALVDRAFRKVEFREAAQLFDQAYQLYRRYHHQRTDESRQLALRYHERGLIKIYADFSEPFLNPLLESTIIEQVDNRYQAELVLSFNQRGYYRDDLDRVNRTTLTEAILVGKEPDGVNEAGQVIYRDRYENYIFTQQTRESKNHYYLKGGFLVSGLLTQSRYFNIDEESTEWQRSYSGNIPPNGQYPTETVGKLKSEDELKRGAQIQRDEQLQDIITDLLRELENL